MNKGWTDQQKGKAKTDPFYLETEAKIQYLTKPNAILKNTAQTDFTQLI